MALLALRRNVHDGLGQPPMSALLSIVHGGRLPEGKVPETKADFPPDIVFEIISSAGSASQMARKRKDYQESGIIQVWVDPQKRLVELDYPDRPAQYFAGDQSLAIDKLPNFIQGFASTLFFCRLMKIRIVSCRA